MIKVDWLAASVSLKGGCLYWIFLKLAYNLLNLQAHGKQGPVPEKMT
jgi:hypothetical protein